MYIYNFLLFLHIYKNIRDSNIPFNKKYIFALQLNNNIK
jgi:hypothetical protein